MILIFDILSRKTLQTYDGRRRQNSHRASLLDELTYYFYANMRSNGRTTAYNRKRVITLSLLTDTDDVIHPLKTPVHSRYIMRRVMRMRFHDVIFAVPFTPVRKQMRFNYLKGARACAWGFRWKALVMDG